MFPVTYFLALALSVHATYYLSIAQGSYGALTMQADIDDVSALVGLALQAGSRER